MPVRATKRGADRTRLERDCDVLVCGASFAGLAVARELAGTGARVLVIDRYEIGERQTSACGIPTSWLTALELTRRCARASTSSSCTRPCAPRAGRCRGRSRRSTTASCARCCGSRPRRRSSSSRPPPSPAAAGTPCTPTAASCSAPLIVDALGWRRVLSNAAPIQPPDARALARPGGPSRRAPAARWSCGSTPATSARATAGASPRGDELRVGVGSFWPSHHVKEPTVRLARDLGLPAAGYQGNWIPHQLRRGRRGRRVLRRATPPATACR